MTPAYLFPGMNPRETGCVRWAFARDTAEVRGLAHSARSKRTGFYTRPLPNPPHTTEPVVVVVVVRVVVVAIGAPRVVGVVVPIAAAQNTVAHVPVAPKAFLNSRLTFSTSAPQSACSACPRQLFQRHSRASLLKLPHLYWRTFQRNRRRASATFWRHNRRRHGQTRWPRNVTPSRVGKLRDFRSFKCKRCSSNRRRMVARHSANCALSSAKRRKSST